MFYPAAESRNLSSGRRAEAVPALAGTDTSHGNQHESSVNFRAGEICRPSRWTRAGLYQTQAISGKDRRRETQKRVGAQFGTRLALHKAACKPQGGEADWPFRNRPPAEQ